MPDEKQIETVETKETVKPTFISPQQRNMNSAIDTKKESVKEEVKVVTPEPKKEDKVVEPVIVDIKPEELPAKYKTLLETHENFKKEIEPKLKVMMDFDKDPIGTLRQHYPDLIERLTLGGDNSTILSLWQNRELLKTMKDKYPDDVKDDWIMNPAEAYTAGTPSYYFRTETEKKEKDLERQAVESQKKSEENTKAYQAQIEVDKKFIADTYEYKPEELESIITEFDQLHEKVAKKELPPEQHPLSFRNVVRGVYFDKFAKILVDKAIKELHEQYKAQGMVLRNTEIKSISVDQMKNSGSELKKDDKPKKGFSILTKNMSTI